MEVNDSELQDSKLMQMTENLLYLSLNIFSRAKHLKENTSQDTASFSERHS